MTQNYQQIMVPIDGSKNAKIAFKRAIYLAKQNRAQLHLVTVIDTQAFQPLAKLSSTFINQITESAKQTLDRYQAVAKNNSVNTDYSIEYGSPAKIIAIEVTKRWHVDLIIIASQTTHENQHLGSVAHYVLQTAPCSTLLVRK